MPRSGKPGMSSPQQTPKAVDIAQASKLTGLSENALRTYVEQGTLDSIDVGGTRMIPVSELASRKLLHAPAALEEASGSPTVVQQSPTPAGAAPPPASAAPQPPPPGPGAAPPAPPATPVTAPAMGTAQMAPPGYPPGQFVPGQPGYPYGPYPERGGLYTWYRYPALRWLLVLLLLALIGLVVWLLAFRSDDSGTTATVERGGGPVGVSQEDLIALSQQIHQPIYWAGTMPGTRMELTETDNSYAYIRYLTEDAPVGDASPDFLTVGTYPSLNAYRNLRSYARNSRATPRPIHDGGVAVVIPGSPTSVYFAYPHVDVQVEVYDPEPQRALDLVKSGVVRPVTTPTSATATASTTATTRPGVTPVAPPGG